MTIVRRYPARVARTLHHGSSPASPRLPACDRSTFLLGVGHSLLICRGPVCLTRAGRRGRSPGARIGHGARRDAGRGWRSVMLAMPRGRVRRRRRGRRPPRAARPTDDVDTRPSRDGSTTTTASRSGARRTSRRSARTPRRAAAAPPARATSPDGWWYGIARRPRSATTLTFDLACYYLGAAAEEEAAARGDEVEQRLLRRQRQPASAARIAVADAATRLVRRAETQRSSAVDCAPRDVEGDVGGVASRAGSARSTAIVEQYRAVS